MTIAAVRCHRTRARLHTPFVTALRRVETLQTLLVEILDTDGASGWGEAAEVWQVTGDSVPSAEACVLGPLRAVVEGRPADDFVTLSQQVEAAVAANPAAKAAVDVALHDLAAHRMGVPLARLLGGACRRVPTDVTLSAGEAIDLTSAARARVGEGFEVLKVKVGTDAAGDVARVRAVREAAGPAPRIRLDANQGWTPREAVTVISAVAGADLGVELVEQPVHARDLDGLAWVRARSDLPVMADEAVFGARDLVEVISRGAADLVNVKIAKAGGLRVARTLLELARDFGVGTIVGSMMESPVGVGAAASLVAAQGTTLTSDLDAAWWLAESPVRGGIRYDGPTVVLPDAPGLGVDGLAAPPGTADG